VLNVLRADRYRPVHILRGTSPRPSHPLATLDDMETTTPTPLDAAPPLASGDDVGEEVLPEDLDLGDLEPATPPLIDEEGRVRLSFSRVDSYGRCPAQFRFQYVDGLPGEPSPHLSFGTSIHAALERFYDRKLPECPTEGELLSFLYEEWEGSGFEGMDRDEQLRWYRHAQEVLLRFHAREAPRFRLPADTEKWFEVPFAGEATVVGSIDRVDVDDGGSLEVIDYKTSKRVRDRSAVRRSLQLAIYALACEHLYGRLPAAVTLDFVVAGVTVRVGTDEIDLDRARVEVRRVADAVRAGAYEPTPNRLCDWCDYRALCPAWKGDGPDLLGPATRELERLRYSVRRDVRSLRQLEAAVDRLRTEHVDG
jgi:putative RecB family exonuclease